MEATKAELAERFFALVESVYRFMREGPLDALGLVELTKGQIRALMLLREGPHRMGEIAAQMGTGLSAATSLVDRLVAKGLVERAEDPADRRLVMCRLAPAGEESVDSLYRMGQERVAALAEALSVGELKVAIRGMEVLAGAVRRHADRQDSGPVTAGRDARPSGARKRQPIGS